MKKIENYYENPQYHKYLMYILGVSKYKIGKEFGTSGRRISSSIDWYIKRYNLPSKNELLKLSKEEVCEKYEGKVQKELLGFFLLALEMKENNGIESEDMKKEEHYEYYLGWLREEEVGEFIVEKENNKIEPAHYFFLYRAKRSLPERPLYQEYTIDDIREKYGPHVDKNTMMQLTKFWLERNKSNEEFKRSLIIEAIACIRNGMKDNEVVQYFFDKGLAISNEILDRAKKAVIDFEKIKKANDSRNSNFER